MKNATSRASGTFSAAGPSGAGWGMRPRTRPQMNAISPSRITP